MPINAAHGDLVAREGILAMLFPVLFVISLILSIIHDPWWLISTMLLGLILIQQYRYYLGTPWRRQFFKIRNTYIIENAKASANNPNLTKSKSAFINFLCMFYKQVLPDLSNDEIHGIMSQIEKRIEAFADRDNMSTLLKKNYPNIDDVRLQRLLGAFESDIKHPDNRLAMLKIFTIADIIQKQSNEENRIAFLYTAIANPKTIYL